MLRVLAKINCVTILLPLVVSQNVDTSDEVKLPSKYEEIKLRASEGISAKLGTLPNLVCLRNKIGGGKYKNFCSGSLISPQKILSAAHCFVQKGNFCQHLCKKAPMKDVTGFYAVAGSLVNTAKYKKDGDSEQWRKISSAVLAPKSFGAKNDIAVAFTSKPFKFNENVKPVPFATKSYLNENKAECMLPRYRKNNLVYHNVKMLSKIKCKRLRRKNMNDFVCIKSQKGDSGAPLVCTETGDGKDKGDGVVVGVVSSSRKIWGKYHTFLTRVSSYKNFVRKKATKNFPVLIIVWIALITLYFA